MQKFHFWIEIAAIKKDFEDLFQHFRCLENHRCLVSNFQIFHVRNLEMILHKIHKTLEIGKRFTREINIL